MNLSRPLFNYPSNSKSKSRVRCVILDDITNDLYKVVVVVVVVVVEFYTIILRTSKKMLSVHDINRNQIRNE
jgi:hypothetical protein